ncbi:MAG TPA: hypothetical protein VE779_15660 [Candidatus Angelobacter sp.]|nr:hypothetical protein [Candidatus Angelobacter sp.]
MARKSWYSLLLVGVLIASAAVLAGAAQAQNAAPVANPNDLSGMFTFLREGEFVQLTVEDGQLSGFISRFGDTDSDKGEFIDHFFDKTSLRGEHLYFKTKTVHAVWYEFDGTLSMAAGKQKGEEGYRVLNGKLMLHKSNAMGKEEASERTVEFKSFPDMQHMKN